MNEETASVVSVRPAGRARGFTAIAVILVAAVLTVPSVVAFWGHVTLTDTERYVATVAPLASEPAVQAAIADAVSTAVVKSLDVNAVVTDALNGEVKNPATLAKVAGYVEGAIASFTDSAVLKVVSSDAFHAVWVDANRLAQRAMIAALDGDGTAVQVSGGKVVLDTSAVIDAVKTELVAKGVTQAANVTVPVADRQIVLVDSPQLEQARSIYSFANPVSAWFIVVVLALYGAGIGLAVRRRRAVVACGVALAVNGALMGVLLAVGSGALVDTLAGTAFGPAAAVFFGTLFAELSWTWLAMVVVGVAVAGVAGFRGAALKGRSTRDEIA